MDHVAILRKANISKGDNLLGDILNGTKTIESRWYVNRISPWNQIKKDDKVFFKESGKPVSAKATVARVFQFDNLSAQTIKQIINDYGQAIAPNTTKQQWLSWAAKQDKKRYCILVFLSNVEEIEPFNIDKKGFGISSAWLAVGDINKIKA